MNRKHLTVEPLLFHRSPLLRKRRAGTTHDSLCLYVLWQWVTKILRHIQLSLTWKTSKACMPSSFVILKCPTVHAHWSWSYRIFIKHIWFVTSTLPPPNFPLPLVLRIRPPPFSRNFTFTFLSCIQPLFYVSTQHVSVTWTRERPEHLSFWVWHDSLNVMHSSSFLMAKILSFINHSFLFPFLYCWVS